MIFLFIVLFLKYFEPKILGLIFREINFFEFVVFKEFREFIFTTLGPENLQKLIPPKLNPLKVLKFNFDP